MKVHRILQNLEYNIRQHLWRPNRPDVHRQSSTRPKLMRPIIN